MKPWKNTCAGFVLALSIAVLLGACAGPAAVAAEPTPVAPSAAAATAPRPSPTPPPADTRTPTPAPTLAPTALAASATPEQTADAVAGLWTGNAAGKIGGRSLPPSPVEISIEPGCRPNQACGYMKYKTGCEFHIMFVKIMGEKYIFTSSVSGGPVEYCIKGRTGSFSIQLRADGTGNFLSQDTTTRRETVFATGILVKQ